MENVLSYIVESSLILVPVIYILGMILKGTEKVSDKYIPVILLPIGIILSILVNGINASSVIQGILVVGVSVYTNQLIKQTGKEE